MKHASKPVEFSDVTVWAAWLYYVDELTQKEVAARLGTSRVTVIKLLADAKKRGLVTVDIDTTIVSRVALSRDLSRKYGLEEALVMPDLDGGDTYKRLGRGASVILLDKLSDGETLAVAWGRTVSAVAESIPDQKRLKNITVCQLVASPDGMASDFSPELCSSLLASRLGAKCVNILAPAVVSSAEIKASLMEEPSIAGQFEVIQNASTALFGIGEIGPGSTITTTKLHTVETLRSVQKNGGVAVLMGLFLDASGKEVRSNVNDRQIGANLDTLRSIPRRICAAGGKTKIAAIRAALAGGYVTHLVTDEATARGLVA
ncbi:MAG: sugar-binding transcriptional regulator [Pseudomonadota bacterium]